MSRITLASDLKTRNGVPEGKDARLTNSYVETKGDQSVVRKRPAAQGGIAVGTGTAQGGIGFMIGSTPYFIGFWADTMQTYTGGGTSWNSGTSYLAGEHVTVDFEDYWATAANTGSQPPSANWSTTQTFYTPPPSVFTKVVANGLDFVGKTSSSGLSWSVGSFQTGHWDWISYSSSLNLYVSISNFYNAPNNIATSSDGIIWTQRTCPSTYTSGICWSPTLNIFVLSAPQPFIGPGNYNSVYTSTDGINWTARLATVNDLGAVCWSPTLGKFAAISSNLVHMSSDGITWTLTSTLIVSLQSIVWGNGKFVATGGVNGVQTSTDGITWIDRINPFDGGSGAILSSVTYSPTLNKYVAIQWASGATVLSIYSSDGITWLSGNLPSGNHRKVYWSNGLSKFITNLGYESSDGITWTQPIAIGAYCIGSDD